MSGLLGAERLLSEVYRCAVFNATFVIEGNLSPDNGYFHLGPDVVCYGQCASGKPAKLVNEPLYDVRGHVVASNSVVKLPFDPVDAVNNLQRERYLVNGGNRDRSLPANGALRALYYAIRPALGVGVRKHVQRLYLRNREKVPFPRWPVDVTVEKLLEQLLLFGMKSQGIKRLPFIWFWPDGLGTCAMISHDVETEAGLRFVPQLMDLNDSFGIKTSFQIIPEMRYTVSESELECIRERGFEINVHDLNHDGHLFSDRQEFLRRAQRINQYAQQYGALGFRSAVMYRNVEWFDVLEFSYDMSVPNVAHLDPQRGGCCTVLPYFIGKMVELPVTTIQDYSLFHILKDYSIRLWKEQIARIQEKHGQISVIIHPDYVIEKSARRVYIQLLEFLCELRSSGQTWIALPGEVASWWRLRSQMTLVKHGDSWRIDGKGSERAKVAYATLDDDVLTYEVR